MRRIQRRFRAKNGEGREKFGGQMQPTAAAVLHAGMLSYFPDTTHLMSLEKNY